MHTIHAFSYLRCSTPEQKLGDSIRRQLAKSKALADRKGWRLDESLHLHDEGKSGFYGDNLTEGELWAFIELVTSGQIPKGSVLIVESLDRLSREQLDDAYQLFRKILLLGIDIATVTPEEFFTKASLNDPMKLVVAIMVMSRCMRKRNQVGSCQPEVGTEAENGGRQEADRNVSNVVETV